MALTLAGCRTMSPAKHPAESDQEVKEALTAVAGAVSGRTLTEEEKQNLERQIRTDPEAQSAIEAISGSVAGQSARVKYCPVDGQRYAPHMENCPEHNVPLEIVEP